MGSRSHSRIGLLAALGIVLTASEARADDTTMPSETVKAQTATKGSTDIAKGGFVATERPKDDDPSHATSFDVAAGGLFTSGNSRTIALTSSAKLRLRRDENQFSTGLAGNFARSGKVGKSTETTVENVQGLLRYDYFLSDKVSLFLQSTARRDRFQGLNLRLNVDPGVAYYFIDTKQHRLQAEVGYDFQYDIRRDDALDQKVPDGSPAGTLPPPRLDKTQVLHNARLFLGYENKLRKEVSLVMSGEYIQNFADSEVFRLIGDVGLKSNVADSLALATTYTIRYENSPLPNVEKADSIASVTFVYTFF
jgi:putative salt-induced outer membrane protein